MSPKVPKSPTEPAKPYEPLGRLSRLPREILTDHIIPKLMEQGPSTVDAFLQVSREAYRATAETAATLVRQKPTPAMRTNAILGGTGAYKTPAYSSAVHKQASDVVERITPKKPMVYAKAAIKRARYGDVFHWLRQAIIHDPENSEAILLMQRFLTALHRDGLEEHLSFIRQYPNPNYEMSKHVFDAFILMDDRIEAINVLNRDLLPHLAPRDADHFLSSIDEWPPVPDLAVASSQRAVIRVLRQSIVDSAVGAGAPMHSYYYNLVTLLTEDIETESNTSVALKYAKVLGAHHDRKIISNESHAPLVTDLVGIFNYENGALFPLFNKESVEIVAGFLSRCPGDRLIFLSHVAAATETIDIKKYALSAVCDYVESSRYKFEEDYLCLLFSALADVRRSSLSSENQVWALGMANRLDAFELKEMDYNNEYGASFDIYRKAFVTAQEFGLTDIAEIVKQGLTVHEFLERHAEDVLEIFAPPIPKSLSLDNRENMSLLGRALAVRLSTNVPFAIERVPNFLDVLRASYDESRALNLAVECNEVVYAAFTQFQTQYKEADREKWQSLVRLPGGGSNFHPDYIRFND